MSDRVSETILLCEDDEHERLTKAYLKKCGQRSKAPTVRSIVANEQGGNDAWVLNRFPKELHACRQRLKRTGKTRLIVLIDADKYSAEDRRRQLLERATAAGLAELAPNEPVALLIPKRNIEKLYEWSRPNAIPGSSCVPSLAAALADWRKIG
jgi:hypothetical protein